LGHDNGGHSSVFNGKEGDIMKLYKYSILAGAVLFATPSFAADPPTATEQETARLAQQTALLTAQANLATAKAALDQAKVKALGLPEFKNETTLETGGGVIEANMLASRAVRAAADHIKLSSKCTNAIDGLNYLMLTPSEKFDVNAPVFVQLHAGAVEAQLRQALDLRAGTSVAFSGAGAILGIVQAAASLFASETKVSGVDLPSINDAALIMATAGSLCGKGIVPSASIGLIDPEHSVIIKSLSELQILKLTAADARRIIPDSGTPEQKRKAAALDAAMTSYDGFIAKISAVDANGQSPLSQALLVEKYPAASTKLIRIAVNKAGGSIINSKNLWTTLGVDPVKVSGGLVVSYSITKADTGAVTKSETFTCQTSLASLRKIQDGRWTAWDSKARAEKPGDGKIPSEAFCR
jgi:hypothetical protein